MPVEPVQSFEKAFSNFTTLIRSLPEDIFLSSLNGWSPRDIVAHLIGWNGLMIVSCQNIMQGKAPGYYADAANGYRNINAGFVARFASTDRESLLSELLTSKQAFVASLQTIDPAEWDADHGVEHYRRGPATVARVLASLAGDYQDHARQIETWLSQAGIEFVGS